jgi:LysM repeat protein/uncharacterized protein YkwD
VLKIKKTLLFVAILAVLFSFQIVDAQGLNPMSQASSAPAELINAVNSLRLANGLPQIKVHPVLMQIAQIEVEGIAAGMGGHWRPNNITLGQWLLSLGYPLSGDLSLDGFRSENWVMGPGLTVQDAIKYWQGDDPHLNTMLSPNRSDIGAGVATSIDEWGQSVYYYVLETALQTTNGQMQYDAYPTLTAIALTQVTVYGDATQVAQSFLVPQYIVPVVRATARPDGDVIHEVKNGQSLWSIAIEYGVKIEQIRQLNNLSSTDIRSGQKLLVQKGATQPMPTTTVTETPVALLMPRTPVQFQTPTPQPMEEYSAPGQKVNTFSFGAIAIAVLFLGGIFILLISRKK